jgi:hypothetical protein
MPRERRVAPNRVSKDTPNRAYPAKMSFESFSPSMPWQTSDPTDAICVWQNCHPSHGSVATTSYFLCDRLWMRSTKLVKPSVRGSPRRGWGRGRPGTARYRDPATCGTLVAPITLLMRHGDLLKRGVRVS